jgi:hypothetical protein
MLLTESALAVTEETIGSDSSSILELNFWS